MLSWGVRPCGHRRIASGDLFADNLPTGSGLRGALRVIRGGSWNNKPRNVRSATGTGTSQTTGTTTLFSSRPVHPRGQGAVPRADPFTDGSGVVRGCP